MIVAGTPEDLLEAADRSYTGAYLRRVLGEARQAPVGARTNGRRGGGRRSGATRATAARRRAGDLKRHPAVRRGAGAADAQVQARRRRRAGAARYALEARPSVR